MLSPDARSIYTAALTPPPGYVFDQALTTTFSLDPVTLLSIPTHLILLNRSTNEKMDTIGLFEGLRKTARRIAVYVQQTQIKPPTVSNVLCPLLETVLIEVRAPRGGSFHPKLWLLRFVAEDEPTKSILRLLVLSRNLTADRSWDLSLQLEGRPSRRYFAANRELGELVRDLPTLAVGAVSPVHVEQAAFLADELRRTAWEVPGGFESIAFHVLGRTRGKWHPPDSEEMAIISPFLRNDTLIHLRKSTRLLSSVLSRPEELEALTANPKIRNLAQNWWVLEEAAELEDGEDVSAHDVSGLHAKAYALNCGKSFRLFVGSANATNSAMLRAGNVEVLAELTTRKSNSWNVASLFGEEGLGPVLSRFSPPVERQQRDTAKEEAEQALETARYALASAGLRVICKELQGVWQTSLVASHPFPVTGIHSMQAWPISLAQERSVDAMAVSDRIPVLLGQLAASSVTGLIAFEIEAQIKPERVRFVLNLPIEGIPSTRDDAILQAVVTNREGFLRYLLLLLGEFGEGWSGQHDSIAKDIFSSKWRVGSEARLSLLEELTRAFCRDPQRLTEIGDTIKRLRDADNEIVPPEFLSFWEVFEEAIRKRSE